MKVNFEYYKAFYYVATQGSLTRAALAMGVTQPALSKAVFQLEKALNCTLFVRRRKGMELTAEGQVLFRYIAQAYEHINMGEKNLEALINLGGGEIHVGSSDIILKCFLLPHLVNFHNKYPEIRLRTHVINATASGPMLRDGKIDLAIVTSPILPSPDLSSQKVGEVHDIFVAGRGFNHLRDKIFSLEEIVALPLISPSSKTGQRLLCDQFFRSHSLLLNPEIELATTMLVPSFAIAGLGVGLVMREFVLEELERGELFEVKTSTPIPPRELSIVTKAETSLSYGCKELITKLGKVLPKTIGQE